MFLSSFVLAATFGCAGNPEPAKSTALTMPTPAATQEVAKAPVPDAKKTVLDVALGSPDHTTLVAAVKAAGLADALNSPGGIYTVFAPTNAAFDALPAGTVEGLLAPEKKADLRKIVQHHAAVPIVPLASIVDGQTLTMSDGSKVTFTRTGDVVKVDGATILGSVSAVNGIVYVVDAVVLPPSA